MLAASAAGLISSSVASGDAEGYVFADGVGEEEGFLRDESDVAAEVGERVVADGTAVDQDCAGGGVVDARDQVDQRGFAGAGGADYGEAAAGGDAEVDVFQNLGVLVGEV